MNGLEALENWYNTEHPKPVEYCHHYNIIKKELEVLDIIKKHATNDGWSNGWVIKFWEMNETELKKINKCLEK